MTAENQHGIGAPVHANAGNPELTAPAFLQDAWYVAGFGSELGSGALVDRVILARPIVLYRDADGVAAAIGNRCPHRFAPLSKGKLAGSVVTCGYHGLGFDRTGQCVRNPHSAAQTIQSLSVPAYVVRETDGLLWIWMGQPDRADATKIPAFECLDTTRFHVGFGYLYGKANYELMSDNILDLSHIEFLHPALGTEAVSRAKVEVEVHDTTLTTTRLMLAEQLPPRLARIYQTGGALVNRRMSVTWQAPATMLLKVEIEPVEEREQWSQGSQTLHIFTPETATSTHYFYVGAMNREHSTEALTSEFLSALGTAFVNEDKAMIDAQQAMIGQHDIMDLKPSLLPIDKAAIMARRILSRMIEQPGAAAPS